MKKLDGCVALITGAGRGIGAAMALRYAREGAKIVVVDLDEANARSVAEQVRALGVVADAFVVDVREPAQSAAMIARVVDQFGRLDVLGFHSSGQHPWVVFRAAGGRATNAAANAFGRRSPKGQDYQHGLDRRSWRPGDDRRLRREQSGRNKHHPNRGAGVCAATDRK